MTTPTKWIAALLIGSLLLAVGAYFSFRSTTWDCGLRMKIGDMHREKNSFSMSNTIIETPGVFLNDTRMSIGSPFPATMIQYAIHGDGNYRLKYSDNISKIGVWVGKRKVYEGPPIAELKAGTGMLGIDVYAEGKSYVEAMNQCSIGSLVKSIF